MLQHFDVTIVSQQAELYKGKVSKFFAISSFGELEILANHAPMITDLQPGPVWVVKQDGTEEAFFIHGGLLEVNANKVNVLASAAERTDELDEQAALVAKSNVEAKLNPMDVDYKTISKDLAVAQARLEFIKSLNKN